MAAGQELKRGTAQRKRVDTGVAAKATVFVSQQQLQISRIDAGSRIDRQTPAAVGHRIGAQQFAVAIDDRGGDFTRLRQRQWAERNGPGGCNRRENPQYCSDNPKGAPATNSVMAGLVPAIHVFLLLQSR